MSYVNATKAAEKICVIDPNLQYFKKEVLMRMRRRNQMDKACFTPGAPLTDFANGYMYFGFHRTKTGWVFREWLPGADAVCLMGDFNGWDRTSHALTRDKSGVWSIELAGCDALKHGQHVKLVVSKNGNSFERVPAYIRATSMDEKSHQLCGVIWAPEKPFAWTDNEVYGKKRTAAPLVYEAHIGMAQEYEGIGTYREFADNNLQRIADLGYNTIQLMAIQEHPYYASFGYQVTNFFAPSYRFGSQDDLRYLINKAHGMGLYVLLDVVHSHACPNTGEGLNLQDGTDNQYFLEGQRGWHSAWGTKVFNYGKTEVMQYLLSNLKYWMEEFHFDGFRFDGVTSMLYENHGLGVNFTDYKQYFGLNTNIDAIIYLQFANELIHKLNPGAITIAEEMSGMPGVCLSISSAGLGFDYRLAMGVPDYWIKLTKEYKFEDWNLHRLWTELTIRRPKEKTIGYCESHDQALVGDQTLMFRMCGPEMYTAMDKCSHSLRVDQAVDYHKLIRFSTIALSGSGYLNFMGNEFGHPEWIDFPREGNNSSYKYARRQWSLSTNGYLKYEWLYAFDKAMIAFANDSKILAKDKITCKVIDQDRKIFVFERGGLIYVFNFNVNWSDQSFFVSLPKTEKRGYRILFSTDDSAFGGNDRVDKQYVYIPKDTLGRGYGFGIYIPCRTAIVLKKV